jgi:hypothetical protein
MTTITVINDEVRTVEGDVAGGRVLLDDDALRTAIGWELKPEGLCRDDVCVPVKDPAAIRAGDRVDLVAAGRALGRPTVLDAGLGVVAVALPTEQRKQALDGLVAPPFALPDLDGKAHELAEWHGRKKLLHAFSTW